MCHSLICVPCLLAMPGCMYVSLMGLPKIVGWHGWSLILAVRQLSSIQGVQALWPCLMFLWKAVHMWMSSLWAVLEVVWPRSCSDQMTRVSWSEHLKKIFSPFQGGTGETLNLAMSYWCFCYLSACHGVLLLTCILVYCTWLNLCLFASS